MTPEQYLHQTPLPGRDRWDHQVEGFLKSCDRDFYFLSCEQRTGKTQIILDTAGYRFFKRDITGLVIAALPGGAPRNWADEINLGMLPPNIPRKLLRWDVTKAGKVKATKKPKNLSFTEELDQLLKFEGLAVLLVNGEATITDAFCDFTYKFLKRRPSLFTGDESTLLMKTPGAARTKALYHLGKHAPLRRCLDGTPTGQGPLDLFSQYRFLSETVFGTTFASFKGEYCEMVQEYSRTMNKGKGGFYATLKRDEETNEIVYRNIERLRNKIEPHTYRVRFFDVFKNVPRPIYQKRYLQLAPAQRRLYNDVAEQYKAELADLGTVTVANVLTRYLRLQQITCGFWPSSKAAVICVKCEAEGCDICDGLGVIEANVPLRRIIPFDENPRILALKEELTAIPGPTVIWCRFNQDIEDVLQLCREMGRNPVRYDGAVDDDQKHANKASFQAGLADTFVAKTRSAGRAVSTSAADNMIYYSGEFGLNQRLQSEVRPLTGTRTTAYGIVDLIAEDTKDEQIVSAHRAQRKLSDLILNELSGKWI